MRCCAPFKGRRSLLGRRSSPALMFHDTTLLDTLHKGTLHHNHIISQSCNHIITLAVILLVVESMAEVIRRLLGLCFLLLRASGALLCPSHSGILISVHLLHLQSFFFLSASHPTFLSTLYQYNPYHTSQPAYNRRIPYQSL